MAKRMEYPVKTQNYILDSAEKEKPNRYRVYGLGMLWSNDRKNLHKNKKFVDIINKNNGNLYPGIYPPYMVVFTFRKLSERTKVIKQIENLNEDIRYETINDKLWSYSPKPITMEEI